MQNSAMAKLRQLRQSLDAPVEKPRNIKSPNGEKQVRLDTLIPNDKNPRKITKDAMEKLCESITRDPEFMPLRPIVIDEARVIIGGNQRYKACRKLGLETVPESWVRSAHGLTQEQRDRFMIIDNAPDGMSGDWDFEILKEHWEEPMLEDIGFSFSLEPVDYAEEWQGMPEFSQDAQKPFHELTVRFTTEADYKKFARLVKQNLSDKTKSIWYPKLDQDQYARDSEYAAGD